jgi:hypothetical protein
MLTAEQLKTELSQFNGTENYYKHSKDLELGEVKSQELLPEYQEQNQITLLQEDNLWH